jgi:hypothetical protein
LHACEEMDDFFSLYLVGAISKAYDDGFGYEEDKTPWQAQERKIHRFEQHHYDFPILPSPFYDHLDDDYEQGSKRQIMFSLKLDEEDLHGSGSSSSSSVYDSQEIQKSAG